LKYDNIIKKERRYDTNTDNEQLMITFSDQIILYSKENDVDCIKSLPKGEDPHILK